LGNNRYDVATIERAHPEKAFKLLSLWTFRFFPFFYNEFVIAIFYLIISLIASSMLQLNKVCDWVWRKGISLMWRP